MASPYSTGLPVTRDRFLFLDDRHVQSMCGVRRNFHQLQRLTRDRLIVPDRPTDLMIMSIQGSVLRDTRDNSLHMWHQALRFKRDGMHTHACYARSADGVHWDKPELGVLEIDGCTAHNVVMRGLEGNMPGVNIVHCPDESDANRRLRRLVQTTAGTAIAYSADGIHWTQEPYPGFHAAHGATMLYDCQRKRYIARNTQLVRKGPFLRRVPMMATSNDGAHWSEWRAAMECDELDDKLVVERLEKRRAVLSYGIPEHFHEQIGSMFYFNYADLLIGLPQMFDCCGYDEWKGTPGGRLSARDDSVTHIQLTWCYGDDVTDWRRPAAREPLLPIGEPPQWDCGFHTLSDSPVRMGDELWFYYGGCDASQQHPLFTLDDGWTFQQGDVASGISVATLRLDGFASLDADRQGGQVTTEPLAFDGERVLLNAVSYHGLAAEVLDEAGQAIPGFEADQCVPIRGDSVRHEVRFKKADVSRLKGKNIRLRLKMSGVMLFAIAFE